MKRNIKRAAWAFLLLDAPPLNLTCLFALLLPRSSTLFNDPKTLYNSCPLQVPLYQSNVRSVHPPWSIRELYRLSLCPPIFFPPQLTVLQVSWSSFWSCQNRSPFPILATSPWSLPSVPVWRSRYHEYPIRIRVQESIPDPRRTSAGSIFFSFRFFLFLFFFFDFRSFRSFLFSLILFLSQDDDQYPLPLFKIVILIVNFCLLFWLLVVVLISLKKWKGAWALWRCLEDGPFAIQPRGYRFSAMDWVWTGH